MLNFSPASERNKDPIAERLLPLLQEYGITRVLEVGSGSGQHALYFTELFPSLQWQCSELLENVWALQENLKHTPLQPPLELDVMGLWPLCASVQMLYSANTLHIMSWPAVEALFANAGKVVEQGGLLCVYGPFRYQGAFTTDSNAAFDQMLRRRDPASGIRDFESVERQAVAAGFGLLADYAMPANNQLLVWQKKA